MVNIKGFLYIKKTSVKIMLPYEFDGEKKKFMFYDVFNKR